jgi:hypothetical protein
VFERTVAELRVKTLSEASSRPQAQLIPIGSSAATQPAEPASWVRDPFGDRANAATASDPKPVA